MVIALRGEMDTEKICVDVEVPEDPPAPLPPPTPPTEPMPAPVTDPPSEPKPKGPFTV
jgi:hypothetical protein